MNTDLVYKIFKPADSASALPLRLAAGVIFSAHGAQKLFGWFGGYGLEGTGQFMASMGLEPGLLMALLTGGAEFFGGLALLLGLAVRPASMLLAITMLVAIVSVHLPNGLFLTNSGYEFALALLGISIALLIQGAGCWSLDNLIVRNLNS
ncbi:MAG TPA: DoxX family protein [Gammaproteobacteria bacterium]|nr:putative oxidoreductase MhqP [bacterium BMS3Abin11]GMT39452.1 MAG: oxidoreductase [bacterium]HDH15843.1 DoxX family protein [Gammaproteobacteria bacterium]